MDAVHKEAYDGALRDFESRTDALKKEKEKDKAAKGKARANKTKENEQKRGGDDASRAPEGRRGRIWSGGDWANWRKQQEAKDAPDGTKTEEKTDKEKGKKESGLGVIHSPAPLRL